MTDLYGELGVERDASPEDIAAAHRAAVKRHHPDAGGDREHFERAQHAALVLRDPARRARYDATGDDGTEPDNTSARRNEMVVMAFDMALTKAGAKATATNIIALAQLEISHDIAAAEKGVEEQQKEIGRIRDRMERLTRADGRTTLLHDVMARRIGQLETATAQTREQIELAHAAYRLVGEYAWRTDPPPPPPPSPTPAANPGLFAMPSKWNMS